MRAMAKEELSFPFRLNWRREFHFMVMYFWYCHQSVNCHFTGGRSSKQCNNTGLKACPHAQNCSWGNRSLILKATVSFLRSGQTIGSEITGNKQALQLSFLIFASLKQATFLSGTEIQTPAVRWPKEKQKNFLTQENLFGWAESSPMVTDLWCASIRDTHRVSKNSYLGSL